MAIPAEHLYVSCTCTNGMRDGQRCADCGGRGIVSRGTVLTGGTIPEEPSQTADEDDGLDDMSVTHLRSRAKDLGLSAGGSKAALVASIREATRGETSEETDDGEEADQDE